MDAPDLPPGLTAALSSPDVRPLTAAEVVAGRRRASGSVLVIVLVTLLFATTALLVFIDQASNDLLVEVREADAMRLRSEAYSALETTLAVLATFHEVGNGLRSPAEGWQDPLRWSDYEPAAGREVEITFTDESGKLSLPQIEYETLAELFRTLGVPEPDVEPLTDALFGWMRPDHVARSSLAPQADDYARAELPFLPPERSLRSFSELRAIERIREVFFDELGRTTDLGRRFMAAVSLFDYKAANINAASGAVLAARGGFNPTQIAQLEDYRAGRGMYQGRGGGFFQDSAQVASIAGGEGSGVGLGTEIQALRIGVTVRQGQALFQLAVVVAPPGGAKVVPATALPERDGFGGERPPAPKAQEDGAGEATPTDAAEANNLNYPFTLLEIRENDAVPGDVPMPAPDVTL